MNLEVVVFVLIGVALVWAAYHVFFASKKQDSDNSNKAADFEAPYKVEPPVVTNSSQSDNVPLVATVKSETVVENKVPELKVETGGKQTRGRKPRARPKPKTTIEPKTNSPSTSVKKPTPRRQPKPTPTPTK
jgi:FtsZ-interacting cell division protein ZipA